MRNQRDGTPSAGLVAILEAQGDPRSLELWVVDPTAPEATSRIDQTGQGAAEKSSSSRLAWRANVASVRAARPRDRRSA
jgi:hypothetical protein